ncbi:MAG TPA: ATPase, T2SS/T4P/T4SS family [Candidatus Brocadiales bacterium]|nr:ATPase, T2SS/T4P/T4SS family [Candidatus Brocadiales bacterium]
MRREKLRLGDLLVSAGIINEEQLARALQEQKKVNRPVGEIFVALGLTTEEIILRTLERQLGVPYVDLGHYMVDKKVISLIPQDLARRHLVMPLFKIGSTLTVAMANPLNVPVIDELRDRTHCEIGVAVSSRASIQEAIDKYYGFGDKSIEDAIKNLAEERFTTLPADGDVEIERLHELTFEEVPKNIIEEAPVIKLLNAIIMKAIREGASDIHLEPEESNLRIRYRVDGILHEASSLPRYVRSAIISRIKVLGQMDIAETRIPQDGRFKVREQNRDFELRVSSFPTIYGENVVIRILDQTSALVELKDLGFSDETRKKYEALIGLPYGFILLTGPTGSGKTTTLYASLNKVNTLEKNIITIEDPVEYRLNFVRQTQVNPKAGLTFATGLRSILRQDPNIIMVGEIRDFETAEIAIHAAMTGHLVLSTLHTNDAPSALTRLIDMYVEPFMVASSVVGVLAQRLVRTICPVCKTPYKPTQSILEALNLSAGNNNDIFVYKGNGCENCRQTGYKGRKAIYELLLVDNQIANMVLERQSASAIRNFARETQGMKTLWEDGVNKVLKGVTTIEEVLRVTTAREAESMQNNRIESTDRLPVDNEVR